MLICQSYMVCRFFEEVSARDVAAVLNHVELDTIEEVPSNAAATAKKSKAANTKCAPSPACVMMQSLDNPARVRVHMQTLPVALGGMFPTKWPITYVTSPRHSLQPGNADTPFQRVTRPHQSTRIVEV